MPVHRKHVDASGLLAPYSPRQTEEKHDSEHQQTYRDVRRVQTDERIVGRSKKISGDGETVLKDQSVPFLPGAEQKETAKHNRQKPQTNKSPPVTTFNHFSPHVN